MTKTIGEQLNLVGHSMQIMLNALGEQEIDSQRLGAYLNRLEDKDLAPVQRDIVLWTLLDNGNITLDDLRQYQAMSFTDMMNAHDKLMGIRLTTAIVEAMGDAGFNIPDDTAEKVAKIFE